MNDIIEKTRYNSNYAINYLRDLFNNTNDFLTLPIKCSNPLTAINCFIPLPSRFIINNLYSGNDLILQNNNEYKFLGSPGTRILFSDKILPFNFNKNFPIPFTFPIYDVDHIDIVLSNVYYYELKLENNKNLNNNWSNECISIGYGHNKTNFKSHVGWYDNSVGYHSDDGTIRKNQTQNLLIHKTKKLNIGDTVGAGLIYTDYNFIKPFFTLNGELIYTFKNSFQINQPYFPMIGYDHPNSISLNFSTSKFLFNLKDFIYNHSNYIISTYNSFILDQDIGVYLNDYPKINIKSFSL